MQLPLHSAYTSFFLVLSLFPGLLLLLGLLRYTPIDIRDLTAVADNWLPPSLLPLANALIEASYRHSSGTVVTISVIGTLVSASRGMFGIRNGLDAIDTPAQSKSYLRKRGTSVLYNISFLLALVITLLLYLLSDTLLDYLWMTTAPAVMLLLGLVDLRGILLLFLQAGVFTAMYALLPDRRNHLRSSFPGAVFASVGWLLFSELFSIYVEHFTSYANIYGSLYALALGMLWLYFCIYLFFLGAALNHYWARRPKPNKGASSI
jgi:membrane protein